MIKEYRVDGLDCADCAAEVEKEIKKMEEAAGAELNFAAAKLTVEFKEGTDIPRAYLKMLRVIAGVESGVTLANTSQITESKAEKRKVLLTKSNLVKLFGAVLFIAAVLLQFVGAEAGHAHGETVFVWNIWAEANGAQEVLSLLFYYAAFIMCGHTVLKKFFTRLIKGKLMDENFLMAVVGIGALILGENLEAVAILIFYQVGELCQSLAVERSRNMIKSLVEMGTRAVNKLAEDGRIAEVPPESVEVGDKLIVRAGEKVAFDGVVYTGASALDTSALTGESMPVSVREGDSVFSGSVNLQNVFTESVRKQYSESTVAKILGMVENAANKKAKSEQFITRFSKIYTPCVVLLALIIAFAVPLVFGLEFSRWIYIGLTFLIVSCPCALVLSIPMSFFGGVGAASRRGILLKGSNYLEQLAKLDTVVFDKTGTLTRGVFEVTHINPAPGVTAEELLETAAYAESMSTHPIARSIVSRYGAKFDTGLVSEYSEYGGTGISAVYNGGRIFAGNARLMETNGVAYAPAEQSGAAVYIAANGRFMGSIVLDDTVKPDAAEAVAELKALGVKNTVMLTGDKAAVGERVGRALGIDEIHSQLLPEDKLEILDGIISGKKGNKKSGCTAFVGEGINDVPSITRADVGIAMGALGSDAAMEVANVVLMTDEACKLPMSVRIARKTRQIVFVNIIFTLLTKLLIMALSIIFQVKGIIVPNFILLAEFADVGVALIAILYAVSILRYNPSPRKGGQTAEKHIHSHHN